jgi:hypothetical protein
VLYLHPCLFGLWIPFCTIKPYSRIYVILNCSWSALVVLCLYNLLSKKLSQTYNKLSMQRYVEMKLSISWFQVTGGGLKCLYVVRMLLVITSSMNFYVFTFKLLFDIHAISTFFLSSWRIIVFSCKILMLVV